MASFPICCSFFVCILNCGQAVIRMFNCLSIDKQEIDVLFQTGQAKVSPYPEPVYTGWSSVHCNATGMPLECHWLTQCTLGYHWATQQILAGYTGTPLEKLSWNSPTLECHWRNLVETAPHWDATGETLTFAAYTGTPLERLWQPTHARHIQLSMQSSIHARLKWQDGGTKLSKWTGLCIFSLYLEFTALQWIPVPLLTHVSTSTSHCACLWYEHHYSFCVFGAASQMKSVELKQLSPYQLYT